MAIQEALCAGVVTASNFAIKIDSLQAVALAATDMPLVGGLSPPPQPYLLSWPTVWVHFCELGRVRQDFDRNALEDLMNFRFSDLHGAVSAEVHRLAESPGHITDCHAARIVSAATRVHAQKPQPSQPVVRLREKTNARITSKSRLAVVHLGKGTTRRERVANSTVACHLSCKEVRKDNIARHMGSQFCQNLSRAREPHVPV